MQLGVHSQSAAVGGILMNKMGDASPDEKRKANKAWKQSFEKQELFQKNDNLFMETTPVVYL